ncbi:Sensor histidine kinase/response regulator [hydrothermal vent metagenome]|uniref:Sensor histidine kinase/response regulator n=1 Tax=hydrothermal vent metagenome TaxID=652676 RepID=A0A3B1BV31_9ZZZZ
MNLLNMYKCIFLTSLLVFNVACSKKDEASSKNTSDTPEITAEEKQVNEAKETNWKVVDSFNVGENVFVRSLAVDENKNTLWVGTSVGVLGVDLHTLQVKNTFTRKDGLANEYVFGIGIDKQGYKWFGTNGGGVSRYKEGQWKTYFPLHGLADYWIYTFASQKDGTLWIGTWAGANRFDLKTGEFTTYVKELVNEWVYGLGVDKQDRVWFGTEGGVSMFDGTNWQSWTHKDGLGAANIDGLLPSNNTGLGTRKRHDLSIMRDGVGTYNPNYVFSICIDKNDHVWAGTWGGGVGVFDGKEWKNITHKDGLSGNVVYAVIEDDKGNMWFGTDHGVSRYDGDNWLSISVKDGLIDEHVYSLVMTKNGDIWAATKGGVSHLGQR